MKSIYVLCSVFIFVVSSLMAHADDDSKSSSTLTGADFEACALPVLKDSADIEKLMAACEAELNAFIEFKQPLSDSEEKVEAPPEKAVESKESERIRLADEYEACMYEEFNVNFKLSEAFPACEKRLDAYLATHDKHLRDVFEQRIKVAAESALSQKSLGYDD